MPQFLIPSILFSDFHPDIIIRRDLCDNLPVIVGDYFFDLFQLFALDNKLDSFIRGEYSET